MGKLFLHLHQSTLLNLKQVDQHHLHQKSTQHLDQKSTQSLDQKSTQSLLNLQQNLGLRNQSPLILILDVYLKVIEIPFLLMVNGIEIVESQGSGQRGDHLRDETVQVGVGWTLDVETATADIIDGLVVKHDGNIGVLEERVSGEHGIVWLDNGVEDHEALETGTLVGELTEAVKSKVNNLLASGVVAASVVIGCVLLARDQLLWVVELTVGAGTDLVNHGWLKIEVDGTWDVLAGSSLREEGVERIVTASNGLV